MLARKIRLSGCRINDGFTLNMTDWDLVADMSFSFHDHGVAARVVTRND
jgi:hypothetical protein